MKAVFDHKDKINHNVTTFWFKPPHKVTYTAGQFTEIYLPHRNPDERGQKRWFTLSASPTEDLLSITTKYAGEQSSTFKKILWRLKPGTVVDLAEPMGDFVLPKDKNIPLVFVAGGIGVTPFRSMIKWLLDTEEKRQIQFIYAVSEPRDAVFVDLFKSYGTNAKLVVKSESQTLTAQKILDLVGSYSNKRIYISGPEPMVEALEKDLLAQGIDRNQLVGDFFPGYKPI